MGRPPPRRGQRARAWRSRSGSPARPPPRPPAVRLDGLATEYPDHLELVDNLRAELEHEAQHAAELEDGGDLDAAVQERLEHQEIRLAVVAAQRDAVIRLRDDGVIGDDALRLIERDLDLEAVRAGA